MKIKVVLIVLAVFLICGASMAQTKDVPADHWAYDAVESLSEKGLVLGYPDGNFLGSRSVTRYEMAVMISRVLENLKHETIIQTPVMEKSNEAVKQEPAESAIPEVTKNDLALVNKLVDEFKTELTVIGADMKSFDERLSKVEGGLDSLAEAVNEPEGSIQTTISDVKKLKKIRVSGYVQGRYEYDQSTKETSDESKNKNSFSVRRARIKVAGNPTDNTGVVVQLDAGGNDDAKSVVTKDAYLDYYIKGNPTHGPTLTFGQFKWPFGYQVVQSSSVRETPERARVIRTLFPGERDRGLKFSTAADQKFLFEAGIFNGTGANLSDNNNDKDIVARMRYAVTDHLDIGLSGYSGKAGSTNDTDTDKTRYGADIQYYMDNTSLKAEYVKGKDLGYTKEGYWAQIVQDITNRDKLVAMYDFYKDPSNTKNGKLTSWDLGLIHALDTQTNLKLFYQINKEQLNEYDNDVFRFEIISKY